MKYKLRNFIESLFMFVAVHVWEMAISIKGFFISVKRKA